MPEIQPRIGYYIKLKGVENQTQLDSYEIIKMGKNTLDISNGQGVKLKIHKSRVKEISMTKPDVAVEQKKESNVLVAETSVKKKQPPKPIPFDIQTWYREHGGVHLSKNVNFDCATVKVVAHTCIDEKAGYYHTINTYLHQDGTLTLGKKGKGGSKYPLKGRRVTIAASNGKPKLIIGKKTAQEYIDHCKKNGYQ